MLQAYLIAAATALATLATPAQAAAKELDSKGWTATADSDTKSHPADHAVDGDLDTFWSTEDGDDAPEHPHHIDIYMDGQTNLVSGMIYQSRGDGSEDGRVGDFAVRCRILICRVARQFAVLHAPDRSFEASGATG